MINSNKVPSKPRSIWDVEIAELEAYFIENNEKKFHAKQVFEWLWKKGVVSFDDMSNLSKSIRELLKKDFTKKFGKNLVRTKKFGSYTRYWLR